MINVKLEAQFKVHLVLQHVGGRVVWSVFPIQGRDQEIKQNQAASTLCTRFRLSQHVARESWCLMQPERDAACVKFRPLFVLRLYIWVYLGLFSILDLDE